MPQLSAPSDTVPSQLVAGRHSTQSWVPRAGSPLPIVILASGNGTNLQAILDRFWSTRQVRVVGVASNHKEAKALERARRADVPTAVFERGAYADRNARDLAMANWINNQEAKLVVTAGYLELLSANFVNQFQDRIINIHPSLLPAYPGLDSIRRAYEDGVRRSGITIHFIDEGVDTGPVIKRKALWRLPGESLERFEKRVHKREHELLPRVIGEVAAGKLKLGISQNRAVVRESFGERLGRYRDHLRLGRESTVGSLHLRSRPR